MILSVVEQSEEDVVEVRVQEGGVGDVVAVDKGDEGEDERGTDRAMAVVALKEEITDSGHGTPELNTAASNKRILLLNKLL